MESKSQGKSVISALIWKFGERFGVQVSQFILQLVLARLLGPAHFSVLALMVIFTNLANVFIQHGFNTALIQNKDVTEDDSSSVLWITLCVAGALYAALFFSAPFIADFYDMPDLVAPFRALCLMLFPGAFNSIQLAKVSREMDFKKIFRSNVVAILVAGIVGVILAVLGAGLWALVAQNILNMLVACLVMWFTVRWRPRLHCDFSRIKVLFSFGWKLTLSHLIDTLYQDLRALVIGKKYDSAGAEGTLGLYNQGKKFPQFIITAINSSVQSVMLPAMSAQQEHGEPLKKMMRNSIMLSSYIIFPIMAGLAGVAEPMVRILLGEAWMGCVPYLQIYCFTFAFYPVHTCNLQAINAIGRSDIFLKLEIIKKSYGLVALVIAVLFFESPIAIAMTGVFTTLISCFVNAFPSKKLVDYSYFEQMRDILPSFVGAALMFGCVWAVTLLQLNPFATIGIQVVLGVVLYLVYSIVLRLTPFTLLLNVIKGFFGKKNKQN